MGIVQKGVEFHAYIWTGRKGDRSGFVGQSLPVKGTLYCCEIDDCCTSPFY